MPEVKYPLDGNLKLHRPQFNSRLILKSCVSRVDKTSLKWNGLMAVSMR